ncbi:hypothetical protein LGIDLPPJ_00048 [Klebsiella phage KP13-27]|nr:hypothetical protein LGIDLPPJ_00048 [Klebsiella phage KP13-27]
MVELFDKLLGTLFAVCLFQGIICFYIPSVWRLKHSFAIMYGPAFISLMILAFWLVIKLIWGL